MKSCRTRFLQLATLLLLAALEERSIVVTALSLPGKRALVTGASGGIGRGIALELARLGCHVVVHYHERHEGAQETKRQIMQSPSGGTCPDILRADFRQVPDLHRLMNQVDEIWPDGFDILINNAGIVTKLALEDDTDDLAAWHECMAVNLHAPRLLSQLALPRMQQRIQRDDDKEVSSSAVIVHVGSIHSEKSNEFMGAYAASKAALDSLTRTMALEFARYRIRVNCVAPGVVPVERTQTAFFNPDNTPTAAAEGWLAHMPLERLGTVEDVAQTVVPLLTNDWVTGAI